MTLSIDLLKNFISIESVVNHENGNQLAIDFITNFLDKIGFHCEVIGQEVTGQPCVIAKYKGRNSKKKIILYGHYDVAPVKKTECWESIDPFILKQIGDRFFARGIADNKGTLFARLEAVAELIESNDPVPEILWLIQGEEEVDTDSRVAKTIFKSEIANFGGKVFVEETGFNDLETNEQIMFLWRPKSSKDSLLCWHPLIETVAPNSRIEFRHLNKFNGISECPLLVNLPDDATYIGFGPNDKLHQIHRENESLNIEKLHIHKTQFKCFLVNFAAYPR